jgi:molybdenum cofactor biosynthesis protein MoaF
VRKNDEPMAATQDWIPVGALGEAFGPRANVLPWAASLSGRDLRLFLNGSRLDLQFREPGVVHWASRAFLESSSEDHTTATGCIATEIRPGICFVDFVNTRQRASTLSVVLDLTRRVCTVVLGQLPTAEETSQPMLQRIAEGKELTSVSATFFHGSIDAPVSDAQAHAGTSELVGKRIEYTYSPTERYEHVYLNEKLYSWHCLEGSERGLADTDRCHAIRIAPLLYLFVWREKIVPTLGVVLLDLDRMKTTGKILGYRTFGGPEITNFPVGAHARVVSGA